MQREETLSSNTRVTSSVKYEKTPRSMIKEHYMRPTSENRKLKTVTAKNFKNILRDSLEEKIEKTVQKTKQKNQKDEKHERKH